MQIVFTGVFAINMACNIVSITDRIELVVGAIVSIIIVSL